MPNPGEGSPPPVVVTDPPQPADTSDRVEANSATWAPGPEPAEALKNIGPDLARDTKAAVAGAKGFASRASSAIKKATKKPSLRPQALYLSDPEPAGSLDPVVQEPEPAPVPPPFEGPLPGIPQSAPAPKLEKGKMATIQTPDGDRFAYISGETREQDGKTRVRVTSPLGDRGAYVAAESLKDVREQFDGLKPAEIKKQYRNMIESSVNQISLLQNAAPKEKMASMREAKERGVPLSFAEFKSVNAEAAAGITAAEQELAKAQGVYGDKFKDFHKKNSALGRLIRNLRPLDQQNIELNYARTARNEARMKLKDAHLAEARTRLLARGKSEKEIDTILDRYNGIYLFSKVIAPGANQDTEMRAEVLGEKGPNALAKAGAWYQKKNEWLEKKVGKKTATVLKAIGSAALVTGAAAAGGSFAAAGGILAAAGYGTFRVGRALWGTVVGTAVGEVAGRIYKGTIGKEEQQKAAETLKNFGRRGQLTAEILDSIDKQRSKLISRADDATLEKKTRLVKGLFAAGFGAGTVGILSAWENAAEASAAVAAAEQADAAQGSGSGFTSGGAGGAAESAQGGGTGPGAPPAEAADTVDTAPAAEGSTAASAAETTGTTLPAAETTGTASADTAVSAEASPISSLSIEGNINNADRLVGHFGVQLAEQYPDISSAPPAVREFLELLKTQEGASLLAGEDQATLRLGLQDDLGRSAVLHPGDTIKLLNDEIVIERAGGVSHVLVDAQGTIHTDHPFTMRGVEGAAVTATPEVSASPEPVPTSTPEVVSETPEPPEVVGDRAAVPEAAPEVPQAPQIEVPQAPEPVEVPEAPVEDAVPYEPAVEVVEDTRGGVPETPPEAEAPAPTPEAPIESPNLNAYGIEVDPNVAAVYADPNGTVIIHGGSLTERMQLAGQYLAQNREAMVYFDSTMPDILGQDVPHLTRAFWDETANVVRMPNEAMDSSLRGVRIPTADNLSRRLEFPQ